MINILHISPNFNYACGISKYITIILNELIKYPEFKIHFVTNGGDSLERLEKNGIIAHIIKFDTGTKNILFIRKNLRELENFCQLKKIHIIHTHHRYPEFLANKLKNKLGIKTITTVHSLVKGWKGLSFKSDKIIAVSKAVEKNLVKSFGVDPTKIIQLYNPIYLNENQTDHSYELDFLSKYRILLFVGRYHRKKGFDLLLNAFNNISKIYTDLALVIVSDIEEKQKKKIIRNNNRIFIFPVQKSVHRFYSIAEIVVLPSFIESFPYVMLESGLNKKLFIGSNVGGISEFIEDRKNGLLFENGNLNSLITKLDYALKMSNEEKKELSNNLFNKVSNLYTPSKYAERLIKIYQYLLCN